jgi:hypothetical protein
VNYAVKSSYALLLLEYGARTISPIVRLKEPNTKDRKFEEVVEQVNSASALVIVGK